MARYGYSSKNVRSGWVAPIVLCFIPFTMWIGIVWVVVKVLSGIKININSNSSGARPEQHTAQQTAQRPAQRTAQPAAPTVTAVPKKQTAQTAADRPPVVTEANPAESEVKRETSLAKLIKNAFRKINKTYRGRAALLGIGAASFLIAGVAAGVYSIEQNIFRFGAFISPFALFAVACGLFGLAARAGVRASRYTRYQAVIGSDEIVKIDDIVRATGYDEKQVIRDMQRMIDGGYFTSQRIVLIDRKFGILAFSRQAYNKYRDASGEDKPGAAASPAETQKQFDEYERILQALQTLDDTIDDIGISDKIQHIKRTSASIFAVVRQTPAKLPQIRRLMNYYLPTTMKLLEQYAKFEKQGVTGENVDKAKADIDRVLGTLAEGFERQLNNLYASDAIDIAADVAVLENMMARDGLSDSGVMQMQTKE